MKANQVKCTYGGCYRTSEQPDDDGWSYLSGWGPGIKNGYYCKAHADALESMHLDGSLAEIQGSGRR